MSATAFQALETITARNRANARHSTGPRTEEGKARAAQNSFRHGLSIQRHIVLPHEDPAAYERLLADIRDIYQPQSRREDLAAEDIAQCRWAFQRFDEAEAVALRNVTWPFVEGEDEDEPDTYGAALAHAASCLSDYDANGRKFIQPDDRYPSLEKILRYRAHWERRHRHALQELDRAQLARLRQAREDRHREQQEWKRAEQQRKQELHALRKQTAEEQLACSQARRELLTLKAQDAAWMIQINEALAHRHTSTPPSGFVPSHGQQPHTPGEHTSAASSESA